MLGRRLLGLLLLAAVTAAVLAGAAAQGTQAAPPAAELPGRKCLGGGAEEACFRELEAAAGGLELPGDSDGNGGGDGDGDGDAGEMAAPDAPPPPESNPSPDTPGMGEGEDSAGESALERQLRRALRAERERAEHLSRALRDAERTRAQLARAVRALGERGAGGNGSAPAAADGAGGPNETEAGLSADAAGALPGSAGVAAAAAARRAAASPEGAGGGGGPGDDAGDAGGADTAAGDAEAVGAEAGGEEAAPEEPWHGEAGPPKGPSARRGFAWAEAALREALRSERDARRHGGPPPPPARARKLHPHVLTGPDRFAFEVSAWFALEVSAFEASPPFEFRRSCAGGPGALTWRADRRRGDMVRRVAELLRSHAGRRPARGGAGGTDRAAGEEQVAGEQPVLGEAKLAALRAEVAEMFAFSFDRCGVPPGRTGRASLPCSVQTGRGSLLS
jgi:hypothetical protein